MVFILLVDFIVKIRKTKPVQLTSEWCNTHEMMLPPFSHLENCNGNHYTIQLSTYARMVEMILNIPCYGLRSLSYTNTVLLRINMVCHYVIKEECMK